MEDADLMNREDNVALRLMGVDVQCGNCLYWKPMSTNRIFGLCEKFGKRNLGQSYDDVCPDFKPSEGALKNKKSGL